jgi:Ca2+-binding RTX toxin-like protein
MDAMPIASISRTLRRCTPIVAVAAVALAAGATPAAAGTLSAITIGESQQLRYRATTVSEANRLDVSAEPGFILISDPGATTITTQVSDCTVQGTLARCVAAPFNSLSIDLGDQNDEGRIDESYFAVPRGLQLTGGSGNDILTGAGGPETFTGGEGDDTIDAGAGADDVFADAGRDIVRAGPGDDAVYGDDGVDTIQGGEGNDETLEGGAGPDDVDGGPGNDVVRGDAGDDVIAGGPGADRLDVERSSDPQRLPEAATALGADRLDGGPGDDRLWAGQESDPVAPDVLAGGEGLDVVDYSGRSTLVRVSLDGRADDGAAAEGDDARPDVEGIVGGSDSDTLIGNDAANALDGGAGDDLLIGLGGADTLSGGARDSGSDTLRGNAGADALLGGAGDDDLDGGEDADRLSGQGGTDRIVGVGGDDQLAGGAGIDALEGGAGNDVLRGGDVDLIGADGGDALDGGAGDDVLEGQAGDDRLDGGLGADRMGGGEGRDTVSYEGRAGAVRVTFDDLPNDGEQGEGDNVEGTVEIVLGGTVGDDLRGDSRDNVLDGGSGEDDVTGGAGVDQLVGGIATDVLRARDSSRDQVACGDGADLAIVDRADVVRDCEWVDRGTRRRPALGRDAIVQRARGVASLRLPQASRFVALRGRLPLPFGSTIDATAARVRITGSADRTGGVRSGEFSRGAFTLGQKIVGSRVETVLRLTGGSFRGCAAAQGAARRRTVRQLHGKVSRSRRGGRRPVRTNGRWASGGVRGTRWTMVDRCDGTLTRVTEGSVAVRDLVRKRTVLVRAGRSYLVRAPERPSARRDRAG